MLNEKYKIPRGMYVVFASILLVWAFLIPKALEKRACDQFAQPLFDHALPAGAELVQQSNVVDDDGGFTAALILGADADEETLRAFYGDTDYAPGRDDYTEPTLTVAPLDEASLDALEQGGTRKAGVDYWFVYIYSAPQS